MIVTQKQADKLVAAIVPEKYKPRRVVNGQPPYLTNISVMPYIDFYKRVLNYRSEEELRNCTPRGLCLNWGELQLLAKVEKGKEWLRSHTIYLCDSFPGGTLQLSFVILHEIGHIDFNLRESKPKINSDLYADSYAFQQLADIYDMNLAFTLLNLYGSEKGWQERRKKGPNA